MPLIATTRPPTPEKLGVGRALGQTKSYDELAQELVSLDPAAIQVGETGGRGSVELTSIRHLDNRTAGVFDRKVLTLDVAKIAEPGAQRLYQLDGRSRDAPG
jgi:hypothetical protein